ncbi:uncharacterized protein LOC123547131 [Mercenaria mercenaria]|uniref:uncharacterized protein LOC123547131 n=1 Tax=Mercenaria mercenaria TaxID=6596 RepID=UPI00234E879A|nr:uncharacterized protein LOC123547131 [Mercenaria mercenaria]
MADSDFRMKDGGISDVMSAANNGHADGQEFEHVEEKHETEQSDLTEPGTENGRLDENFKTENNGDGEPPNANYTNVPDYGRISPNSYTQELDLTDPKSVIDMLENVDLTEEDTEDLLQEAYKMNRKLKEMLRRQDEQASDSKPKLKSKSKSFVESRSVNGQGSMTSSATSSRDNSRMGSSFGIRKVLPPINAGERETSVYAVKLRRSKTNVQETKPVLSDSAILRSKSSTKPTIRKDSESPSRRKKAPGPKPEWNDRFNYT